MNREELVVSMCTAFLDEYEKPLNPIRASIAMATALDVAIEMLLAPANKVDSDSAGKPYAGWFIEALDKVFTSRRARYSPVTLEERITVEEVHTTPLNYSPNCAFTVMKDGKPAGPLHSTREYAETYRLGLIAQLKEPK